MFKVPLWQETCGREIILHYLLFHPLAALLLSFSFSSFHGQWFWFKV